MKLAFTRVGLAGFAAWVFASGMYAGAAAALLGAGQSEGRVAFSVTASMVCLFIAGVVAAVHIDHEPAATNPKTQGTVR